LDPESYSDANCHRYTNFDVHSDEYSSSYSITDTPSNFNAQSDANTTPNLDAFANTHAASNIDVYIHPHKDLNSHCKLHADGHFYTQLNFNAYVNSDATSDSNP
jgi:hypothetical protein